MTYTYKGILSDTTIRRSKHKVTVGDEEALVEADVVIHVVLGL
jgi:hypothetical protein